MNCVATSITKTITVFITLPRINFDDSFGVVMSYEIYIAFFIQIKIAFLQYFPELGCDIH